MKLKAWIVTAGMVAGILAAMTAGGATNTLTRAVVVDSNDVANAYGATITNAADVVTSGGLSLTNTHARILAVDMDGNGQADTAYSCDLAAEATSANNWTGDTVTSAQLGRAALGLGSAALSNSINFILSANGVGSNTYTAGIATNAGLRTLGEVTFEQNGNNVTIDGSGIFYIKNGAANHVRVYGSSGTMEAKLLRPWSDDAYDLGDATHYWRNLYASTAQVDVVSASGKVFAKGGDDGFSYLARKFVDLTPEKTTYQMFTTVACQAGGMTNGFVYVYTTNYLATVLHALNWADGSTYDKVYWVAEMGSFIAPDDTSIQPAGGPANGAMNWATVFGYEANVFWFKLDISDENVTVPDTAMAAATHYAAPCYALAEVAFPGGAGQYYLSMIHAVLRSWQATAKANTRYVRHAYHAGSYGFPAESDALSAGGTIVMDTYWDCSGTDVKLVWCIRPSNTTTNSLYHLGYSQVFFEIPDNPFISETVSTVMNEYNGGFND